MLQVLRSQHCCNHNFAVPAGCLKDVTQALYATVDIGANECGDTSERDCFVPGACTFQQVLGHAVLKAHYFFSLPGGNACVVQKAPVQAAG
jgi:hypothetical protein